MNENTVISAMDYNKVDGRNAPNSKTCGIALGLKDSQNGRELVAQILQADGGEIAAEMPLHQALDMAIFACRALQYFQDAYRFEKLYDPQNPEIARIGIQGDAMTARVCLENGQIDRDIADFSQELSNQGELLGERVRILAQIAKEI